jgi:hypothetical protein
VLPQQLLVDAGLDIKALGKGGGVQEAEVPVPCLITAKENQMTGLGIQLVDAVGAAPRGYVDLTANNGLNALGLAGLVKVHHAIHDAMVGDGHSGLAQLFYPLHQLRDAAGSIQEGKFCVDVQVDKGHLAHFLFFSVYLAGLFQGNRRLALRAFNPMGSRLHDLFEEALPAVGAEGPPQSRR